VARESGCLEHTRGTYARYESAQSWVLNTCTGMSLQVDRSDEQERAVSEGQERAVSEGLERAVSEGELGSAKTVEEEGNTCEEVEVVVEQATGLPKADSHEPEDGMSRDDDDTGSVVEVDEVVMDSSPKVNISTPWMDGPGNYAPLKLLVNDRVIESTMRMGLTTGRKVFRMWYICSVTVLVTLVLAMISVGVTRSKPSSTENILDLRVYELSIRVVLAFYMCGLCAVYTHMVVCKLSPRLVCCGKKGVDEEGSVKRQNVHYIALFSVWAAWLLSPLNIFILAGDIYSYVKARQAPPDSGVTVYDNIWPRYRYAAATNSIFIAFFYYSVIFLFKYIRLECTKREAALKKTLAVNDDLFDDGVDKDRNDLEDEPSASVRGLYGIVPRIAIIYFLFRIGLSEGFAFDGGYIPGISFITVIRFCKEGGESISEGCGSYPLNARAVSMILISVVDWLMLVWIAIEALKARFYLSFHYLLQSKTNLVSFEILVNVYLIHLVGLLFIGILEVSLVPQTYLDTQQLHYGGVAYAGGAICIVITSWVTWLAYFFVPRQFYVIPPAYYKCLRCWRCDCCCKSHDEQKQTRTYYYVQTYAEICCSNGVRDESGYRDTQTSAQLSVLAENEVHTDFENSRHERPENLVTSEMINACLDNGNPQIFSFDIAVLLWNFSHTMYLTGNVKYAQSDPDVLLLVEDERFALVEQIKATGTDCSCAIFASSEMIVVAFRGNGSSTPSWMCHGPMKTPMDYVTGYNSFDEGASNDPNFTTPEEESYLEWFMDSLHIYCTSKPRVNAELYNRYAVISARILEVIARVQDQKYRPLFLTGHGIGGSYATFCAFDIGRDNISGCISVYTFGSPRCVNDCFKQEYEQLVSNHFDIANIGDEVHRLTRNESILRFCCRERTARIGMMVSLDSIGNHVIDPDWLEKQLMLRSKRRRLGAHEPVAYTVALMQWAHRMYGRCYRPLWTPSLHEVKLCMKETECINHTQKSGTSTTKDEHHLDTSWRTSALRSYLRSSLVGLGPYYEGACIRLKVLRITGLDAVKSTCIVTCGPRGISSSLWEVGKTDPAELQSRSTLAGLDLMGPTTEEDSDEIADENSSTGNDDGAADVVSLAKSPMKKKTSKGNLLGLGVDAAALAAMPARFADFDSSESMYFGTYQKLRPCASITLAAVDVAYGNFGTTSFPISKLFPIPHDKAKKMSLELTGRARKENAGELKVLIEVESIGAVSLEALCSSQEPNLTKWTRSHSNSSGLVRFRYEEDQPETQKKLEPNIRLSPAMATFYLKRNFNGNTHRVVLRVGIIKAAFQTLDLKLGEGKDADEIYCKVTFGDEHTETRGCGNVNYPDWNELVTFGTRSTLTGFEELRVEFFANWYEEAKSVPRLNQPRSASKDSFKEPPMLMKQRSASSLFPSWNSKVVEDTSVEMVAKPPPATSCNKVSASKLLGIIELSFSAIITKYQDNLLVKWVTLDPQKTSSFQLPGHVCFGFEVGTEALKDNASMGRRIVSKTVSSGSGNDVSGSLLNEDGQVASPTSINHVRSATSQNAGGTSRKRVPAVVRHASGSLRQFMGLGSPVASSRSSNLNSGQDAMHRALSKLHSTPPGEEEEDYQVRSQMIPNDWTAQVSQPLDERAFIVRVYIHRAEDVSLPESQDSFDSIPSSLGSMVDLELPNPYCELSLLDPLNGYAVTQKKKTVIIRDSDNPVWEEEFTFGKDRDLPVRGNEVLSISVYNWELSAPNTNFGEVRIPLTEYNSMLNMKDSRHSTLTKYDKDGKPDGDASIGNQCSIYFAVIVNEFINRDTCSTMNEEVSGLQLSKSPML